MWQKIKFFFLRRLSDEKLRMWCVEMSAGFDGFDINLDKAKELYDFVTGAEQQGVKPQSQDEPQDTYPSTASSVSSTHPTA